MAQIINQSFVGVPNPIGISDGDEFIDCDFTQPSPWTSILEGVPNCTFSSCDLTNCVHPNYNKSIGSTKRQVDFCSHLHGDMIECGLPLCPVNCKHVSEHYEPVYIEGVLVSNEVYVYNDIIIVPVSLGEILTKVHNVGNYNRYKQKHPDFIPGPGDVLIGSFIGTDLPNIPIKIVGNLARCTIRDQWDVSEANTTQEPIDTELMKVRKQGISDRLIDELSEFIDVGDLDTPANSIAKKPKEVIDALIQRANEKRGL